MHFALLPTLEAPKAFSDSTSSIIPDEDGAFANVEQDFKAFIGKFNAVVDKRVEEAGDEEERQRILALREPEYVQGIPREPRVSNITWRYSSAPSTHRC